MYKKLTTKLIRKRTIVCTFVIVISIFSEAVGLGMIMPLLETIIEPNRTINANESFFSYFNDFTTIDLALLILGLFTIKFCLGVAKSYLMYDVEWRVRAHWISSLFNIYLYKDYFDFEREKPGIIFNNIVNETLKSASIYRQSMEYFAQILQVLALSTILLISNFSFAIIALSIVIVILFLIKVTIISKGKQLGVSRLKAEEDISHDVNEMVHGMKVIRFFSVESLLSARLNLKLNKIIALMRKTEVIKKLPQQIAEISLVLMTVSYVIISSFYGNSLSEALPFLGMMLVVSLRLFTNAGTLASNYMSIKVLWPAIERVHNLIKLSKKNNIRLGRRISSKIALQNIKNIKFNDMSFGYEKSKLVINNINLEFFKNSITTIVGKSGSGKSTIIKLLMKLYSPNSGNITVDGTDISEIDHNKWREIIGYVDQESFFFYGTVRENLTFGAKKYSEKEINAALNATNCSEFVTKFINGIDTMIGDKGNLLSGGQKARLSFARAVLRRPKLLILDEVTSGLDIESKIKKDTIVIAVTHDELLKEKSDYIYNVES